MGRCLDIKSRHQSCIEAICIDSSKADAMDQCPPRSIKQSAGVETLPGLESN